MNNLPDRKQLFRATIAALLLVFWLGVGVQGKGRSEGNCRTKLKGTVISGESKKPVKSALVYIVKGEEETLTNERGEFVIDTWRAVPIELHVENEGYITRQVIIKNVSDNILILILQSK